MVRFKTEKISKRVTRIYGICTELMYLVEGDEWAALLDTGSGYGSLKSVVDKLTDKPIKVLLTHGHTDHAMGASEFKDVYMNRKDDYIFVPHGEKAFRMDGMKLAEDCDSLGEEDYIPTADLNSFMDMKGGDSFDLGGVTIDIFDCAGHTKGSGVMLIREENMLLLGDACNLGTFLFQDYSLSVREYRENLKILKSLTDGKYNRALASHGNGELPMDIIESVIEVCDDIINGNTDDVPYEFRGDKGLLAKAVDEKTRARIDGKSGNIVYNKANI